MEGSYTIEELLTKLEMFKTNFSGYTVSLYSEPINTGSIIDWTRTPNSFPPAQNPWDQNIIYCSSQRANANTDFTKLHKDS